MRVKAIAGEPTRFWVESESKTNTWYLVDIADHDFNGRCNCPRFEKRLGADLRHEPGKRHRCKHIDCARDYALDIVLFGFFKNKSAKDYPAAQYSIL